MGAAGNRSDPEVVAAEAKSAAAKAKANLQHAGGKVPYPKHVWSPAGGWYSQPANWKANTAIMASVVAGITAIMWTVSAQRETRTKFPEQGRFFPSRYWSKQIRDHERQLKES